MSHVERNNGATRSASPRSFAVPSKAAGGWSLGPDTGAAALLATTCCGADRDGHGGRLAKINRAVSFVI